MRKNPIWLAFLILGLVVAGDAWAQGLPTATLSGKVINEGQGLPGVSVAVKSPNLQGTRTTVTSGNGDYSFVALPPGRYTVTYLLTGFQPVTKQVDLGAAQSSIVNATLSLTAVAAEATVVGRAENISETSQAAVTFTSEVLNKLPTARTIASATNLSPGVNSNGPGGLLTISGAQSFQNLYLVNGAMVQDNIRLNMTNLYIEDAVQETTTQTGGISAEYGRFAGGVINTITKAGGNTFSGSLRDSLTNPAWSATPPKGTDGPQKINQTWEATFGGPIIKDAIWFFGAGRYAKTDTQITTSGTFIGVDQQNKDQRYEGKLTLSPLQNHTITASYVNYEVDTTNYYFTSYPVYDLASFYPRQLPSEFYNFNYNGVLTSNFFVEAQYSAKHFTFQNSGGTDRSLLGGTPILDSANGNAQSNSPIFCAICPGSAEKRDNDDVFAKATYFLSNPSIGSMNFVVGVDQFRGHRLSNNYQSGSQMLAYSDDTHFIGTTVYPQFSNGNAQIEYAPIFQAASPSNMQTQSFFLNDTWKINNNLTFNLGVRYDKNHAVDMQGVLRQNDSAWSPRLGVTFDPKGDGQIKFNASYARYVSAVSENLAGGASGAGSPAYFYYQYGGTDINTGAGPYLSSHDALTKLFAWWGINNPDMFPVLNKDSITGGSYPGLNLMIAPGLQSPHVDEAALGFAGSVGPRVTYRVDGTYRKAGGFIDQLVNTPGSSGRVTDPLGNVYDIKVVQNSSTYERLYYGLAASFAWRPVDGLNVGGNWTWSHTYGNLVGETSGSGPVYGSANQYPEYHQNSWFAPTGDLSQDQRHRVRLFGSYDFTMPKSAGNLGVSALFQANSGTPYSAVGTVNVNSYVTNPGYATPPTNNSYYFSSRGAFTTEAWYQLDLGLNYSYNIGPVQVFVNPQILNVVNAQRIANNTYVNTTTYTGNSAGKGLKKFNPFTTDQNTLIECPQGDSAAQCTAMGANWQMGPSFGQSNSYLAYQTPRTFRISFGVRF
jgi:outer membrane receptor for ferrienterochelin and colicin